MLREELCSESGPRPARPGVASADQQGVSGGGGEREGGLALTGQVGSSAGVAAAAAAAQAGAALVQTIGHQTRDEAPLRGVLALLRRQHVLLQTGREAAARFRFILAKRKLP